MKKKPILIAAALLIIGTITVISVTSAYKNAEKSVYRETTAEKGDLKVGITEGGSISIGTIDQTFDLDMSAFKSSSSSESASAGQGSGMFPMMGNTMQENADSTDYARVLEVEEVYVTVGTKVKKGDPLFKLTLDTVSSIKDELETDEASASLALAQLQTKQQQSRLSAVHTQETDAAYGALAQSEYDTAVFNLNVTLLSKQNELINATEDIAAKQAKLAELQVQYQEAAHILENAEYAVKTADTANIYEYMKQEEARDSAKTQATGLEDQIEALQDEIAELTKSVPALTREVNQAKRDLETGTIEADSAYQKRVAVNNSAGEQYSVTVGYLDAELADVQNEDEKASAKLTEFNTYLADNKVCAEYDGVITNVDVAAGDELGSSKTLITLNNQDDITMTVELNEADKTAINLEGKVNINIDSYPDTIFEGTISEIGDAKTNSSTGEITYEVTALITGDVSGLFEGMTGDVTFITKESEQVTYISNRAIIRTGTKSYVNVKDDSGKIVKKEVVTGFSDGVNVEIVEGLSEGDIVLIESKVNNS